MTTFLLLLLIFFVVIPLIKSMTAVYRARKAARRFFDQFRQDTDPHSRRRDNPRQQPPRPRKKINPDDGEFVQFEDLPADSSTKKKTVSETVVEQQVVDVEWEDIK